MEKIVCITHHTYFPDSDDLLKQLKLGEFKYEFIPAIIYTEKILDNISIPKPELPPKSFSLYEAGTSIPLLKGYFGPDFKKDELVLVKKAFQKLKNFASPCSERVIADLCCQVILKTIKNTGKDDEIIFFIEKSVTDKMLGRLGTLYLNLKNTTICFLSYTPDDLMTTVMSSQTGKLHFDLHRLMSYGSHDKLGPYPGSPEDAIKQTYFYRPRPAHSDTEFLPVRFDIFAQGLSEYDIEKKSDKIKEIFDDKNKSLPYPIGKNYALLPIGFSHAKEAWKQELYNSKESIEKLLKEKQ